MKNSIGMKPNRVKVWGGKTSRINVNIVPKTKAISRNERESQKDKVNEYALWIIYQMKVIIWASIISIIINLLIRYIVG